MTLRKISKEQPDNFEFSPENQRKQKIMRKYPDGKQQSAVMSLLYLAQNQMIIGYHCRQ